MNIQAQERRIAEINSHTTVEANRFIQTVEDSTRDSKEFFRNVGGSGSSADLRTQAQILATRAKEKAKEEKAEARAKAKAQKELAAAEAKAHKKQERIAANSKCTVQPKSKPGCKRKRPTGEPEEMQTDQPASPPAAALPPRSELAILQGSGVPLDLVTKVDTPDQMPSDSALGLFRVRPKASQQQPQCTHGSPDIKHYLNTKFLPPALMSKIAQ